MRQPSVPLVSWGGPRGDAQLHGLHDLQSVEVVGAAIDEPVLPEAEVELERDALRCRDGWVDHRKDLSVEGLGRFVEHGPARLGGIAASTRFTSKPVPELQTSF